MRLLLSNLAWIDGCTGSVDVLRWYGMFVIFCSITVEVVGISGSLQTVRREVQGDEMKNILEADNRFLRRWRLSSSVKNFWKSIFTQIQPSTTRYSI